MNSPTSVRARLLNTSRQSGEDFQSVLTRYAIERFLYRLGISDHKDSFVLKGAMLFVAWHGYLHRPTKDLDLLGYGSPTPSAVAAKIREIAAVAGDDGIVFDPDSFESQVIAEHAEYEGVRARLVARLDQARIRMQIDVGFGDAVDPMPATSEFPTILKKIEAPALRMYPPEVVIAEKLHAMVVLDIRNSRMKDFYDVWFLARTRSFTAATLRRAIGATFDRRQTAVPSELPFALTDGFLRDGTKEEQWHAFLTRLQLEESTPDLPGVGILLAEFIGPLFMNPTGQMIWNQGGPWQVGERS